MASSFRDIFVYFRLQSGIQDKSNVATSSPIWGESVWRIFFNIEYEGYMKEMKT